MHFAKFKDELFYLIIIFYKNFIIYSFILLFAINTFIFKLLIAIKIIVSFFIYFI